MRRTVSTLLAASMGSAVAGCALLVSFDGLDDGGVPDARSDQATAQPESDASDAADSAPDTGVQEKDASNYLGCFKDSMTRDLLFSAYDGIVNTTETCVAACITKGYRFAATQFGSECYCGNAYGGQGPGRGCTFPCAGDSTEVCGGNFVNSVYVAIGPAPQATYVGCYADSMAMRELPYQTFGGPYTTVESCAAFCAYHGYLYAGPENGNQCFCGDSYGAQGTSGGCNNTCDGNAAEICGGNYANSVYRTWAPSDAGGDSGDAGRD